MTGSDRTVITDWMRGEGYELFISLLQSFEDSDTAALIRKNDEETRGKVKQTKKIIGLKEWLEENNNFT